MKIEEAMQWCRGERNFRTKESTQHQVMNICLSALEKQIPKEATTQGMSNDGYWIIKCPECETVMEGMRYIANYCCKCGQTIKWSD